MWIVVCSVYWLVDSNQIEMQNNYQKNADKVVALRCQYPRQTNEQEVNALEQRNPTHKVDSFDQMTIPPKEVEPQIIQGPESPQGPEEKDDSSETEPPKHCHYWFVYIAPHVLQLRHRCVKR